MRKITPLFCACKSIVESAGILQSMQPISQLLPLEHATDTTPCFILSDRNYILIDFTQNEEKGEYIF